MKAENFTLNTYTEHHDRKGKAVVWIIYTVIAILIVWTGINTMNNSRKTSSEWLSRVGNTEAFNAYAQEHPVALYNLTIKKPMDGLRINQGVMDTVFWRYTSAKNSIIENIEFTNVAFEKMDFSNTVFRNVTFKGCVIANSRFRSATLDNVRFIDTMLVDNDFRKLNKSKILLDGVDSNNVTYSQSDIQIKIHNSKIYDGSFKLLQAPSSIEITDSEFVRTRIDGKRMQSFKMTNTMTKDAGISTQLEGDAIVDSGELKSFGLGVGAKNIIVRNLSDGHIGVAGGKRSVSDNVLIENCKNMEGIAVGIRGTVKQVVLKNIDSDKLSMQRSNLDSVQITDSEIKFWKLNEAKIKHLRIQNTSLTREANFQDATIEQHNLKDLNTRKYLKLKLDNSNITREDLNQ